MVNIFHFICQFGNVLRMINREKIGSLNITHLHSMRPEIAYYVCIIYTQTCSLDKSVKIITVTSWWARCRLKSPASRLFTQTFVRAQIRVNIESSAPLAFVRGIHRWPVEGLVTRTMFPFDDVSWWYGLIIIALTPTLRASTSQSL